MNKYDNLFGSEWAKLLTPFLQSDEFKYIGKTLKDLQNTGTRIYPLFDDMFRAFKECPYDDLKVVVLTNNPYTKESDGLAFSSKERTKVLDRIFEAVEQDVAKGFYLTRKTDLTRWANQGVLLLNLDLSTDAGKKVNHLKLWEAFMQYLMKTLAEQHPGLIYILIGKASKPYIDYLDVLANDTYALEHPMHSIKEQRPWRHKNIFSDINTASKLINNKEIQWT